MATMTSLANVKDSRWLQLEVCREFQRNKCTRPDTECKFAHPASNVEVQNGRVIACYDSIKGRCNREKPPCKYFHPPQHLKDQLLINGRNHLALKNALLQQMPLQLPMPTAAPAGAATMVSPYSSLAWRMPIAYNSATAHGSHSALTVDYTKAANPYMPTLMASPYLTGLLPGMMATTAAEPTALMTPTTLISPQKRTDRLEDQSTLQQNTDTTGLTQHSSPVPASSVPTMPTSMPALSLSPMSMAAMGGYQTAAHAQSVSHATTLSPSSMVTAQALTAQAQAQLFVHQQQQQQQQQQQSVTSGTTAGGIGVGVGMGAHPAYASASPGTDVAAAAAATTGAPQAKKRARDAESDLLHLATLPGIVQYKRPALEKSGVPVYQPSATAAAAAAYQQAALALQMQQQFVPVSFTGHPASLPRF